MHTERLDTLLADLADTVRAVEDLQRDKHDALLAMDTDTLLDLAEREDRLVERLRTQASERHESLGDTGEPARRRLHDLIDGLPVDQRTMYRDRLRQVKRGARRVKEQANANWLLAYRMQGHVHGLLDVLLGSRPGLHRDQPRQGALLDATA